MFSTIQTISNKLVTLGAMWLIARMLSPAQVGLANLAVTIGAFLIFISPTALGDVLLADPRRFDERSGGARKLAYLAGGSLFLLIVALAFPIEAFSGTAGLASVLVFVGLRPLADATLVVASSRMRLDLEYPRIALIDGVAMFLGTSGTVLLAWLGAGSVSIVLPPIAAIGVRAFFFRRICGGRIDRVVRAGAISDIIHRFGIAAIGQYAHNVTSILEPLVLWAFATQSEQGYFALAFQLAVQANALFVSQFGSVLQPIFSHLRDEPERQLEAFIRAMRMMTTIVVPISLVQAGLAEPLFLFLFEPKWVDSIVIFFTLSLAQASVFVVTLSFTMLKAQGRFRTALVWQFSQLAIAGCCFAASASYFTDFLVDAASRIGLPASPVSGHALAIAAASVLVWGLSSIVGIYLCGRQARLGIARTLREITKPWVVTLPFLALILMTWSMVKGSLEEIWSTSLMLFVVGPIVLVFAILANVAADSGVRADFLVHGRRILERVRRRRTDS